MSADSTSNFTAFIVPHTHWDREWYEPLSVFRLRLVDVIDQVLELLNDPAYRRFTLDGQAIILEDYLDFRPEREAELKQRVQEGRLRIGPWYVLADEFLVSPEALIRNLQLGRATCERFGPPLPVAYTPDSFGHISQLPLLAKGFGLESIVFERGLGDEGERLGSEFRWVAADGKTEVFAAHLIGTYSGAAALGHVSWELTDPYDSRRAIGHLRAALYGVQGDEVADLPEWFRASLERVEGGLVAHATGDALVLLNGSDHLFPQPNLPEIVADANRAFPNIEFIQADVEEYVNAARSSAGQLESYQGEFRGSRYQHILAGVLSARLYLKQANEAAETLLESYAEPLSALSWLAGGSYPQAFLTHTWKLLLQNHPHDSICGCSIDDVHREMMTRYEAVQQFGADICRRAFLTLSGVRPDNIQEVNERDRASLAAFNPLPFARQAVVEQQLELPVGSSENLAVLDQDGRSLPLQVETMLENAPGFSEQQQESVRLRVLATLPPLGIANLRLVQQAGPPASAGVYVRQDAGGFLIENSAVQLTVNAAGNAVLLDRRSGEQYDLNLTFEDQADAGDEYDFSPLANDQPLFFSQPDAAARITQSGPVAATVQLSYRLALPEQLEADRLTRTGEATVPLTLELTVTGESPLLGLRVTFDNTALDHRLRLRVSTGVRAETIWADGHFDVLERPLQPTGGEEWFQVPPGSNHQRRFVAVSDGARGLALLNRGLPEYEAHPAASGVDVAVTLVRSVGWLSRNDLLSRPQGAGPALPTPEAQCLGMHVCELAIYPFASEWWNSALLQEAQAFTAAPLVFSGAAQDTSGLLELSGPLQVTAVKRAEDRDSLIVRVSNPAPVPAEGQVRFQPAVSSLYLTRLDETRIEQLEAASSFTLLVGARSVQTLEVVLEGGDG